MTVPEANEELDLRGIPCPANAARAIVKMQIMDEGEVLLVHVDSGEPFENVSRSLEIAGHSILSRKQTDSGWDLWVKG